MHSLSIPAAQDDDLSTVLRAANEQGRLGQPGRGGLLLGVLLAHGALGWGLMQLDVVREGLRAALPVQVDWIAPPAPTPAPPPPAARPPQAVPRPAPVLAAPAAPAAPAPVFSTPAPEAPAPAVAAVTSPAPPAPAAPPAPPAAPRQLPATALRYLVPPAQAYPLASRRLKEQGTVLLRLVVDAQGLPQQVSLHRSSGHARLDEQALQAMRAARFQPQTENGQPIAWTAIAPLAYELD